MPRIVIDLPAQFGFSTELQLYIGHINYGHHLDNAQLLSLVSEARLRYFKSMGYTELDVEGVGIVVSDAAVQYRSEAFHGEVLRIEMSACDFSRKGCDLVWRVHSADGPREVARGKTGIVFFDYSRRCPTEVPAAFKAKAQTAQV